MIFKKKKGKVLDEYIDRSITLFFLHLRHIDNERQFKDYVKDVFLPEIEMLKRRFYEE